MRFLGWFLNTVKCKKSFCFVLISLEFPLLWFMVLRILSEWWTVGMFSFYCFACLLNWLGMQQPRRRKKNHQKFWGQWCPSGEKSHTTTQMQIFGLHLQCQAFFSGKNTGRRNSTPLVQTLKKMNAFQDFFFGQGISNFFDKLQLDTNWNAKKNEESWMLQHTNTIINWKEVIF